MAEESKPSGGTQSGASEPGLADELRQLGQSFSSLGRTAFREGRVLSVELLRSARAIVDRAREEIERLAGEKK